MNFKAFQRLTQQSVLDLLVIITRQVEMKERLAFANDVSAEATRHFLLMARYATYSFLDSTLTPLERVRQAWYAAYFAQGWRQFLASKKVLSTDFISTNCYQCIWLNAESLLLLMHFLMQSPALRSCMPFAPFLLGSQQNEHLFRDTRRLHGYANFTLADFLIRCTNTQLHNIIVSEYASVLSWPSHRKHFTLDELHHDASPLPDDLTENHLHATLDLARRDAVASLRSLCMFESDLTVPSAPTVPLNIPFLNKEKLDAMTVVELREICRTHGIHQGMI